MGGGVWSLPAGKSAEHNVRAKTEPHGGRMGSGSMFSLGYTAGQSFNHNNTWGVADPMCNSKAIKPFTRDDRVVMLLAKKTTKYPYISVEPSKASRPPVGCNGRERERERERERGGGVTLKEMFSQNFEVTSNVTFLKTRNLIV